jgi:high-affinity iron transporter
VWIFGHVGKRINPRPVMLVSSVLLTALAISLVGQGIKALQEGGYIALSPLPLPAVSILGMYPTVQGLVVQTIVLLLVLAPALRGKRA